MKHFLAVEDLDNPKEFLFTALADKHRTDRRHPGAQNRCLGLIFFNPSLRTKLSSIRAAQHLGLNLLDHSVAGGWPLEFSADAIMNQDKSEHIEEAVAVLSQYCDILAVRAFPQLEHRATDYAEPIMQAFVKHGTVPIINLESATRHPLQGLADMMTIEEHRTHEKPKVVLSWAPHPKALPQSVSNSFVSWCRALGHDLTITHPEGYALDPQITGNTPIVYDQEKALRDADFVYVKNWSCLDPYGTIQSQDSSWMIDEHKMALTNDGFFMHCLPVRRNVVVQDKILRSPKSLVIKQAANRTHAAYTVLQSILQHL